MVTMRFILLFLVFLCGSGAAQSKILTASKVPATSIQIDGVLNEYFWTSDAAGEKIKVDQTQTTYGTIDGDGDCHAFFKPLWSEEGIYIGTWYYDDIHNAMNSQYLDAANIAYDDDGLEYWFDHSFEDAWNATSNPALYYLQLVKGFGNLNPETQYGGWWGGDDGTGKGWSTGVRDVPQQRDMGWQEVFTSADGVNYECELLITWAGSIMRQVGSKSEGGAIGFDMKVNDNDGAFTLAGAMHWSGISHSSGLSGDWNAHWGKIVMGSQAKIRPVASKLNSSAPAQSKFVSDIFGRRIAAGKMISSTGILLAPGQNAKRIVLR